MQVLPRGPIWGWSFSEDVVNDVELHFLIAPTGSNDAVFAKLVPCIDQEHLLPTVFHGNAELRIFVEGRFYAFECGGPFGAGGEGERGPRISPWSGTPRSILYLGLEGYAEPVVG